MWIVPVTIDAMLPLVVDAARNADMDGLIVVLARTADARWLHDELTIDWTSIHDITGRRLAVLCPDPRYLSLDDDSWDHLARMDGTEIATRAHAWQLKTTDSVLPDVSREFWRGVGQSRGSCVPVNSAQLHRAAWTEAVSRCAEYFGIPEHHLPAILTLSFGDHVATLLRLTRSTSFYGLCKAVREAAGVDAVSDLISQQRATVATQQQSLAAQIESLEAHRARWIRMNTPVAAVQDDAVRAQLAGLHHHLDLLPDAAQEQVSRWRTDLNDLMTSKTVLMTLRYLATMLATVLTSGQRTELRRLDRKIKKVVDTLDPQRRLGPPDQLSDQIRATEDQIAFIQLHIRDATAAAEEATATQRRLGHQPRETGLSASIETAALCSYGELDRATAEGRYGLSGYEVRVLTPTAQEVASTPLAAVTNALSNTGAGNVVQAGYIAGGVHFHAGADSSE